MTVSISLYEFFRTGAFGPLHLGMARVQIEAILGPPDDYAVLSRREHWQCKGDAPWRYSKCWRYGGVELFFDEEKGLEAVHLDYLFKRLPSGGEKIQLDPWILHPGLSLEEAEVACTERQLAYQVSREDPFNEGVAHLVFETGADLYFEVEVEVEDLWPRGLWLLYFPDTRKRYYDEAGHLRKLKGQKRGAN